MNPLTRNNHKRTLSQETTKNEPNPKKQSQMPKTKSEETTKSSAAMPDGEVCGGFWSGGGIACRLDSSNYVVTEVGGRGGTEQAFTGVRCFANSPFPEEEGTVYVGGYDPNFFPSEHTAYIFKCRPA